jgi:hypothetical protein
MRLALAVLALIAAPAFAQAANCLCTTGCRIASDPYPTGTAQPTTCTVYKAGVNIGSGAVVASSTIPLSNAANCQPASAAYVPGPAGNVSCLVSIPAQAAGTTVTLTMTATSAAGESAQSSPFSFVSVAALATIPSAPANPRVTMWEGGQDRSLEDQIVLRNYALFLRSWMEAS